MKTFISIAAILVLLLTGCQTSTVISSLEAAVTAAEIAIPVIAAATGLNPKTAAAIVTYLQEVNIATAQAAEILANPSLNSAQKAAQIAKAFAGIAAGCNCKFRTACATALTTVTTSYRRKIMVWPRQTAQVMTRSEGKTLFHQMEERAFRKEGYGI